ncbi:MAG: hypothetical protein UV20_C0050G0004 [Candidatus Magasanikbacteria bacterium GW2011_GWA2_42_32]|uniref:Uncharacterized protein n=1 Tax=Candidatus Magasanikbacteria bacterium GW2011_GWA2_42_32 TaxID=1619039 RepID=A0A0G0ZXW0_9BACT|nr:MAG: hypothetical protein UV20_C0050G0004 [Candidatus Magasanikbacteria bacterium GW2011_GWA2_42_32]
MITALKAGGGYVLGIAGLLLLLAIPVFFIMGAVWVGTYVLPWLKLLAWIVLGIDVIIILPLILFRKTREAALSALYISSYVFGLLLWFMGLLLSYLIWGFIAVFIGLALMGIGVVPIAMLATLLTGEFGIFGTLILLTFLTFGVRFFAVYILEKSAENSYSLEGAESPKRKKWPIVAGVLFWLFGVVYLMGVVLAVQTCTEIDANTRECTPTFVKMLPSTIEVYNEDDNTVSVYDKETGELIESY